MQPVTQPTQSSQSQQQYAAIKSIGSTDALKMLLAKADYRNQIQNYFKDEDEAKRFLSSAMEYVRKNPKLLTCTADSLVGALMTVAQFRFMPSNISGEAFIIPYKETATFQMGYKGWVTLLWRTGAVRDIKTKIVYENETFHYEEGMRTTITHLPELSKTKRGKPIAVYGVITTVSGGTMASVMSEDDVMDIKNMSKAKDKADSPWNGNDPELWMWKKTCLIQLAKLLPKTAEIQEALKNEYADSTIKKAELDADGPGVFGKVDHSKPAPAPAFEGEIVST